MNIVGSKLLVVCTLLATVALSGCNQREVPTEIVTMEALVTNPETGLSSMQTVSVVKPKKKEPTIKSWNEHEKYADYYFCNGGSLWKMKTKGNGAVAYPVIMNMVIRTTPAYYFCDKQGNIS